MLLSVFFYINLMLSVLDEGICATFKLNFFT